MIQNPTQTKLFFSLQGAIVPKARPRHTVNKRKVKTLIPENYRKWKNSAIASLRNQVIDQNLTNLPLQKVSVHIILQGKHSRRGDIDNISGSILDALVQANIIRDDNLTVIPKLLTELKFSKEEAIAKIELVLL